MSATGFSEGSNSPTKARERTASGVTRLIRTQHVARPRRHLLLYFLLKTSEGRERLMRAVQYSLRLYIWLVTRRRPARATKASLQGSRTARLLFAVSVLSTTRKVLALFEFLRPLAELRKHAESPAPPLTPLATTTSVRMTPDSQGPFALRLAETWLSLLLSVFDDVECFGRLGLLARPYSDRAARLADVAWLGLSVLGLWQVQGERGETWRRGRLIRRQMIDGEVEARASMEQAAADGDLDDELRFELERFELERIRRSRAMLRNLRDRLSWLWWERARLLGDLVFAFYEVFELQSGSEGIRALSGCLSSWIGARQVWSDARISVSQRSR
ncbi:uncharacterized protein L969DRAFT_96190 [Mixia osmundae IAM 14324]|uniref:Peroxisomal biogenesis factor 11 n=1 Tax=Mixia osmundae (strain CBS 9802 / IAM 14324 / JCM 22182 / KY 12970) TaxID=764103 RepID=G7E4Q3_MIXOS|nr:uncharacterized protein L969DRAFT_96190 [Mixia osmundae IAM 14324]KEI37669.1 hypothetical protein L969DRAFT_96190 [Mixia osmundae IAM 14324]GAA97813.1 hypothetical protein E5Q_04492 [Mixia osmundae IAM 14324]